MPCVDVAESPELSLLEIVWSELVGVGMRTGAESQYGGGRHEWSQEAGGRRDGARTASLLTAGGARDQRTVGDSAVERRRALGHHRPGDLDSSR